jgi:hypothetical protein
MADNILWYGKVAEPIAHNDKHTEAIVEFNRMVKEDDRVDNVIVPIRDGLVLTGHDHTGGVGSGVEMEQYRATHNGERTRWTNTLFCGMPTYQMSPSYSSTDTLSSLERVYQLGLPGLSAYAAYVFMMLLGFYIMLRAFDFRVWMAALGAVLWAFSSYYFIIIQAGHIWKLLTLSFIPPTIGGMLLCYRGKYLLGIVVTGFFTAMQVLSNHVQMTYYFLFVIGLMSLAFLVDAIRKKAFAKWLKASCCFAIGGILGVCINLSNLYHTWEYSKESMRGKSELVKKNQANQTSSGLDRDYITQWSYGIDETWTLLIPNTKGGASVPLSMNRKAMEKADPNFMQVYQQMGQYWGNQPMTSGPVYVGAFVLMLFVLGLFIVKGPMKWALLAATILSILLSWGRNFMDFTDFFIDYMPMYAKFRTVASILVIAEFTIPLLAMLALKKIVDEPELLKTKAKLVYTSFALTGGICLLFALMPTLFFSDFISISEMQALKSIPAEYLAPLQSNLREMRQSIFTADCWRSFWIITVGMALLLLYRYKKLNATYTVGAIALLCLIDMWQVDKRYLYDDMFVEKSVREQPQQMTNTDRQILRDKSLDYRVLNMASNTFNENETSYYHKSIGGYHAAKLRRYAELTSEYISPEMQRGMQAIAQANGDMTKVNGDSIFPVLNMLNAKYFILPLQGGQTVPVQNPYTYGNGWFVSKLTYVDNANEELAQLGKMDIRHEAVADKQFKEQLGEAVEQDTNSVVKITAYEPNQLTYTVNSNKGGVIVFSEIYYPGWTATVDGHPVELGRVNYVLRALNVKAGTHKVVLSFFPASVDRTETIAYIAYGFLLLAILLGLFVGRKRNNSPSPTLPDEEGSSNS